MYILKSDDAGEVELQLAINLISTHIFKEFCLKLDARKRRKKVYFSYFFTCSVASRRFPQ